MDLAIISNIGVRMSWNTKIMHFFLETAVFEIILSTVYRTKNVNTFGQTKIMSLFHRYGCDWV